MVRIIVYFCLSLFDEIFCYFWLLLHDAFTFDGPPPTFLTDLL